MKKKEPYLTFLRELIVCMLTKYGTKPVTAKRPLQIPIALRDQMRYPNYLPITHTHIYIPCIYRYNRYDYWMVETDLNDQGKRRHGNCKMCTELGKKDMKAVNLCLKCQVPLHPKCFRHYHNLSAPIPV